MKPGLVLCVCVCVFCVRSCVCPTVLECRKTKKKTAPAKSDSSCGLGVWQISQNPLQAIATQRHKAALRMPVSVSHTCCKGDSSLPDNNS